MIRLIKSIYEEAVAKRTTEKVRLETESKLISEASQIVTDRPDRDGWIRTLGKGDDVNKGLDQENQLEMVRKAREFSRFDPNGHGALTTMVNYVMGKGLSITPKSDDPMVWYIWREFWTADRNNMQLKQFELVGRVFRDGEIFIEFFKKDEDGENTGKTAIRFVDPLLVRADSSRPDDITGTGNANLINGVITDPEDAEKILYYSVQSRVDKTKFRKVQAEDMLHIKINVDSDQKRGETQLLSVMSMIKHYQQWLEARIILNKIRSAIVLVKKVTGTPQEVAAIAATIPTVSGPSGSTEKQNIRGGKIITAGPGVEYEMLSPNLNAADAKEDGRNIKTNMAAGLNMPEYVFGDASNQNYASSLIAESPFVKSIQYWQMFFEFFFGKIFKKVIEIAVEAEELEAPDDEEFVAQLKALKPVDKKVLGEAGGFGGQSDQVATPPTSAGAETSPTAKIVKQGAEEVDPAEAEYEAKLAELMPNGKMETPCEIFFGCDMTWPEIVHRDVKQHVDALSIARQNGWLADSTACAALGYDYPEEVRKQKQIEDEAATKGNPLMNAQAGDLDTGTMDAELEDMIAGLSPEERDGVLKAKDPREVLRIVGKKKEAPAEGAIPK